MLSLLSPGWSRVDWATRWRQSGCQWPGARTTLLSSWTARTSFLTRYRLIHSSWVRITFQDKTKLTPIDILFLEFGNLIMRLMMQMHRLSWLRLSASSGRSRGLQRGATSSRSPWSAPGQRRPQRHRMLLSKRGPPSHCFLSCFKQMFFFCRDTERQDRGRNYKITRESYPVCKFLTEKFADWTFELSCIGWWKFR